MPFDKTLMREPPEDFEIHTTADGSPTLAFRRADGYVEKMHHSGGALAESLYIYREALRLALACGRPPRVLSLGLGLGYNELITIAECHCAGEAEFAVWSFEALPVLREAFMLWLRGEADVSPLSRTVADAARRVAAAGGLGEKELRAAAAGALDSGRLQLRGAFPADSAGAMKINCVYYDAYSSKMDPGLWTEDLLTRELGACLDQGCVLATYAATGNLKRALAALGFRLLDKPGFQGKRQSTLAIRES